MVKIDGSYAGDLRCLSVHGPSQSRLATDAPQDNHGKGEAFSPTDLVATALGACIATTVALWGRKHGVKVEGMAWSVTKEMTATPPRKIARLCLEMRMPRLLSKHDRDAIERVAHACPVSLALHPEVKKDISFLWPADNPA
jgi:putative redox protein